MTPLYVGEVFGHGLGGDQAPPIDFSGMQVTVFTKLDPSDITSGEFTTANVGIRFFDILTDENIDSVTYRIEIWLGDQLLARNDYYAKDGNLDVEIKPKFDCTEIQKVKCTNYLGHKEPITGAYTKMGESKPRIEGPIFEKGGLYNIKVNIVGATFPQVLTAEGLSYDTFVSVAQDQEFSIETAQAEKIPVIVKTYYDEVGNLKFDSFSNSISFDMPFDWSPAYVELVPVVHEEVRVPKSFDPYKEGSKFKGYVDGVEVDNRVLMIDPYSSETENIVHFMVSGGELKRINEELGPDHYDKKTMFFELVPQGEVQRNSFTINFESGAKATVEWDSSFGAGSEIPFDITFFDPNGNIIKDIRYGYSITDENDQVLLTNIGDDPNNPGILANEGIDTMNILIPSENIHKMKIAIVGQGLGADIDRTLEGIASEFFQVGASQVTTPQAVQKDEISIPDWVRNNARWWSDDQISDNDFASGIQYMIKEGIIKVPTTESGQAEENVEIPDWVQNNAGWWADGLISDKDFASGIQYLTKIGIILV